MIRYREDDLGEELLEDGEEENEVAEDSLFGDDAALSGAEPLTDARLERSRRATARRGAAQGAALGGTLGATFGPQGAVIGAAAGSALGAVGSLVTRRRRRRR